MDRRQFLKAATLGVGATLVPSTLFAAPFDPGFVGKRFSLVWDGDNYHCYFTDKTFVVAHKAKGLLPPYKGCPDPTYQILKENSFEHLRNKDRIVIRKKKLLEMIERSGNDKTPYNFYREEQETDKFVLLKDNFAAYYGLAGGELRRAVKNKQVSLIVNHFDPSQDRYPNYRYFYGKYHPHWTSVNIDNLRLMLRSAPDIIFLAFNNKTLSITSLNGSWVAFLSVVGK